MAVDVRLTTRQSTALLDLIAWAEWVGSDWWESHDGHEFRILRNAGLRIGAAVTLDLPDDAHSARARGICLRELVKQLRDQDGERG